MKRLILGSISAILVIGFLGGCSMSKQTQGTLAGGAVGGVAGGLIGGYPGAAVGAAVGGGAGYLLSSDS
jgi:hypothetical protein